MHPLGLALLTVALAACPLSALSETAQDAADTTVDPDQPSLLEADTETGLWLLVQRSGAASGSRYTIPGQVATLSYRRYLNSFKYPIPRQFDFTGGGGAGSGMSSGSGAGR
ncbi:MAG TPA: DUF3613 domain-containing protein [Methylococcaceae bacterium]|nr:DUF3613 domain-containing protein [Methylococcaceae bacterium]